MEASDFDNVASSISSSDFEYLKGVEAELKQWRDERSALLETINSLENNLEHKDKALLNACKGIHYLEEKQWTIFDETEYKRKLLESHKKGDI